MTVWNNLIPIQSIYAEMSLWLRLKQAGEQIVVLEAYNTK